MYPALPPLVAPSPPERSADVTPTIQNGLSPGMTSLAPNVEAHQKTRTPAFPPVAPSPPLASIEAPTKLPAATNWALVSEEPFDEHSIHRPLPPLPPPAPLPPLHLRSPVMRI